MRSLKSLWTLNEYYGRGRAAHRPFYGYGRHITAVEILSKFLTVRPNDIHFAEFEIHLNVWWHLLLEHVHLKLTLYGIGNADTTSWQADISQVCN